jgi:hypothetical protein
MTVSHHTKQELIDIYMKTKTIAVVVASADPTKAAHQIPAICTIRITGSSPSTRAAVSSSANPCEHRSTRSASRLTSSMSSGHQTRRPRWHGRRWPLAPASCGSSPALTPTMRPAPRGTRA